MERQSKLSAVETGRKHRHESSINLRKDQRQKVIQKHRKVNALLHVGGGHVLSPQEMAEKVDCLRTTNSEDVILSALREIHESVSVDGTTTHVPYHEWIEVHTLPSLLLRLITPYSTNHAIILTLTKILVNLSACDTVLTKRLFEQAVLHYFVACIRGHSYEMMELGWIGLGNMIRDPDPVYRHYVISETSLLDHCMLFTKQEVSPSHSPNEKGMETLLTEMVTVIHALCDDNSILNEEHRMTQLCTLFSYFLFKRGKNQELIEFTCKSMVRLMNTPHGGEWTTKLVMHCIPFLLSCFQEDWAARKIILWDEDRIDDMIMVFINVCSHETEHINVCLRAGMLPILMMLFRHYATASRMVMKNILWCFSNIFAEGKDYVDLVLSYVGEGGSTFFSILFPLYHRTSSLQVKMEILWCISNITHCEDESWTRSLVHQSVFSIVRDALDQKDVNLCLRCLDVTASILLLDDTDGNYMTDMEEKGVMKWIEEHGLHHVNENICALSTELWNRYGDQQDSTMWKHDEGMMVVTYDF